HGRSPQRGVPPMQSLPQMERPAVRDSRRLADVDPEISAALAAELRRQHHGLHLIASENVASAAVMEAVGSCLTNKYAEGYPGKRYYAGCEVADQIERLAILRAQKLFSTDYH